MENKALYSIGEASHILGCNPETIRRHDGKTIQCKRDGYGNRYLSAIDIEKLRAILTPQ